jgi:hypothetical protein
VEDIRRRSILYSFDSLINLRAWTIKYYSKSSKNTALKDKTKKGTGRHLKNSSSSLETENTKKEVIYLNHLFLLHSINYYQMIDVDIL